MFEFVLYPIPSLLKMLLCLQASIYVFISEFFSNLVHITNLFIYLFIFICKRINGDSQRSIFSNSLFNCSFLQIFFFSERDEHWLLKALFPFSNWCISSCIYSKAKENHHIKDHHLPSFPHTQSFSSKAMNFSMFLHYQNLLRIHFLQFHPM